MMPISCRWPLMAAGLRVVDTEPFGDGREAESERESNDRAP